MCYITNIISHAMELIVAGEILKGFIASKNFNFISENEVYDKSLFLTSQYSSLYNPRNSIS